MLSHAATLSFVRLLLINVSNDSNTKQICSTIAISCDASVCLCVCVRLPVRPVRWKSYFVINERQFAEQNGSKVVSEWVCVLVGRFRHLTNSNKFLPFKTITVSVCFEPTNSIPIYWTVLPRVRILYHLPFDLQMNTRTEFACHTFTKNLPFNESNWFHSNVFWTTKI